MKPFFGFNKTTQQPGYAHQFITKSISKKLENEYDEIVQASYNIQRKLENKLKRYSKYIVFFGIVLLLVCAIFWFKDGFAKMWADRSLLFVLGAIATVVGFVCLIVSRFIKPNKDLLEDLEWNKKELEAWYKKHEEFFSFGENTYKVDILCPQYKMKKDEVKLEVPFGIFNNIPTIMYKEEDKLCISDNMSLYEIPYENVKEVIFSKEPRVFYNWTQEEPFTKEYEEKMNKQVIKTGQGFKAMSCGRVVFDFEGDEYYFEFLPYDYDKIEKIFSDKILYQDEQEIVE